MILWKGWFSDLEILEIHQQVNREGSEQDSPNRIKTLNTEKQEPPNQIEAKNTEKQNATHPSTTKQVLRQDHKINVELMKKVIT